MQMFHSEIWQAEYKLFLQSKGKLKTTATKYKTRSLGTQLFRNEDFYFY